MLNSILHKWAEGKDVASGLHASWCSTMGTFRCQAEKLFNGLFEKKAEQGTVVYKHKLSRTINH